MVCTSNKTLGIINAKMNQEYVWQQQQHSELLEITPLASGINPLSAFAI
jgi:hypothetical protein